MDAKAVEHNSYSCCVRFALIKRRVSIEPQEANSCSAWKGK